MSAPLRVLVVEDEPVAADAHTAYVGRVEGFEVAATVRTGQAAMQALAEGGVDLVLLDMNLPDRHGLEIVRAMRAAGHTADVIAVTSARDLQVVRAAVSLGIVQYLLKPFVFASLRDRLERYRDYRLQVDGEAAVASQQDIDLALSGLRAAGTTHLPKGMSEELFAEVSRLLSAASGGTLGVRGRRERGRLPGDRAPLPRAPGRDRAGAAALAVRRAGTPRGGVPLEQLTGGRVSRSSP